MRYPEYPIVHRQLSDFAQPEHIERMHTLHRLRLPKPLQVLFVLVLAAMVVITLILIFVPWRQVAAGSGKVTALDPAKRQQPITAMTEGRVRSWYVVEGQTVEKGEPLVEVVDLDPQLISRLNAERAAMLSRYEAAKAATETAQLNLDRKKRLLDQGLASRSEYEAAKIKVKELRAKEAEAQAALTKTDTIVERQSSQLVTAPRRGIVIDIQAGDTSTFVKAGQRLATFVPTDVELAAELYISGLDAALVSPGRKVRLEFEGWPAVQFGGWPAAAVGTFGGIVTAVDPAASPNGKFRVLVAEDPEDPWPDGQYLRLGSRASGWILLNEVRLGYEVWRRLNGFPPAPPNAGNTQQSGSGAQTK